MRVFLDTNVLVSAFVSRGLCADLLRAVLEKHELLVSNLVLDEFERVLADKLAAPHNLVERALTVFEHVQALPDRQPAPGYLGLEENDGIIVMTAADGDAEVFVTGDLGVLAIAGRAPLPILSPRRFMELLHAPSDRYPDSPEDGEGPNVSDPPSAALEDAAFEFALEIIELCRSIEKREDARVAVELLRHGTGIGATLAAAPAAGSARQAENAISAALEEARMAEYHLRLLERSDVVSTSRIEPLLQHCHHLVEQLQTTFDPDVITFRDRGGTDGN